jgi:hypothetical protein
MLRAGLPGADLRAPEGGIGRRLVDEGLTFAKTAGFGHDRRSIWSNEP